MKHDVIIIKRVDTPQDVAFITIDDGYKMADATMAVNLKLPVTLFLSVNAPAVFEHPDYFKQYLLPNQVPQSHGAPHDDMRGKSILTQISEIKHAHDEITRIYGKTEPTYPQSPTLFRPPYGKYDDNTLTAIDEIGYEWMVLWSHYILGNEIRNSWHQPVTTTSIQRGDIILCHFEDDLNAQLELAITAINDSGLTPAYLVDYLT